MPAATIHPGLKFLPPLSLHEVLYQTLERMIWPQCGADALTVLG
jgi:hypothetical protein